MILRVPAENVGAAPSLLNRGAGEARITALARTPEGLVAILAMEHVLRDDTVAQVLAEGAGRVTDDDAEPVESLAVEQFVLFTLGGETYGLPIAAVDAVLRLPGQLTRVPKAPAFVAGVMNHRGAVTPVIDQRRRFGVEGEAPAERRRVIVTRLDDVTVGFIVDSVERILDLSGDALTPTPELAAGEAALFDRIARVELDGRLVLLVDPRQLLDQAERDVVRAVAGQTAGQGSATG
jgi:purine-binding chemotaxis protein CheW